MRTDGHTDMTKLTVAFRNFARCQKQSVTSAKGKQIAICSKIGASLINAMWGQNVEFF
jgi:hypothetical protein